MRVYRVPESDRTESSSEIRRKRGVFGGAMGVHSRKTRLQRGYATNFGRKGAIKSAGVQDCSTY